MQLTRGVAASAIAQELAFGLDLVGFNLQLTQAASTKLKAWRNCSQVTVGTVPGDIEASLTLQYVPDWASMQVGMGELAQNLNITLPTQKEAKVPLVAPYEISDALVVGTTTDVRVFLLEKLGNEQPGHLTASTVAPTGRQFQLSAGKITFPATLAGASVAYAAPRAFTTLPSIGKAPNAVKINEYQFIGHACGTDWPNGVMIHIPKMEQSGLMSLNTEDDPSLIEIPYDCLVAAGERTAVHFYLP
jgi:hypothetical protein